MGDVAQPLDVHVETVTPLVPATNTSRLPRASPTATSVWSMCVMPLPPMRCGFEAGPVGHGSTPGGCVNQQETCCAPPGQLARKRTWWPGSTWNEAAHTP